MGHHVPIPRPRAVGDSLPTHLVRWAPGGPSKSWTAPSKCTFL